MNRHWSMLIRMGLSPRNWGLALRVHRYFRRDPEYRPANLIRALWNSTRGERIVRHQGRFVVTSFLPPIPSRAMESVAQAVQDQEHPFTCQAQALRSAPISCFLAVTTRCDLSCSHCSAEGRGATADAVSLEQWKAAVRGLQTMGTAIIGITGGEPLLYEGLEELIATVDQRSTTIVYTNGSRLTVERAQSLRLHGLFAVGISLDSADPSVHDAGRGRVGSHAQALQALRNARQAGLYTMAQTVVPLERLSEASLHPLFRQAKAHGAHEVRILEPIRCGKLVHAPDQLFYTDADRQKLREIQYRANARPWEFPKITTFAHTESAEQFGCGAGTQHSYIDASGALNPCDFVPLPFGNIRLTPIESLWPKMNQAMGKPRSGCLAFRLDELTAGCSAEGSECPRFYTLLRGKG